MRYIIHKSENLSRSIKTWYNITKPWVVWDYEQGCISATCNTMAEARTLEEEWNEDEEAADRYSE
jgi:hypothetical protein